MVKNLKALRKEKNISQQQLANILGISQQAINKYENHKVEPDIDTLIAMADYFGVTLDNLVGRFNTDNTDDEFITDTEKEFILKYRKLSDTEKLCIDTVVKTYTDLK